MLQFNHILNKNDSKCNFINKINPPADLHLVSDVCNTARSLGKPLTHRFQF